MNASDVRIDRLRCEYLVDPLGIDERAPRLSWALASPLRGLRQTAYRIRVASTPEKLAAGEADRWDSGRVERARTTHVAYAGAPLQSRDACFWAVEVWWMAGERSDGSDGSVGSARSETARWTMGLLGSADWSARWIAADPEILRRDPEAIAPTLTEPGTPAVFTKDFALPAAVRRATVYATARGIFELWLGGRRVGEDLFAPEWTGYDTRLHYRTYDVTALLAAGANRLSAWLGDGWWSGYVGWQEQRGRYGSLENSLLVQLEVELVDGRRVVVGTDGSWRAATGPILSSDFMMGETFDARRSIGGASKVLGERNVARASRPWTALRAADSDGTSKPPHGQDAHATTDSRPGQETERSHSVGEGLPAREVPPPRPVLVAQRNEPVRIVETMTPRSVNEVAPGVFIYDLGQNISGWVRLKVEAPAGTRVHLRHGERLNPDGTLYTENLRRAKATDVYVCAGEGVETWEPRFTFHGFQYVELTGLPGAPRPDAVTACVIHSATPLVGTFACSHEGVNRLWLNGLWSQRDNFLTVPTDCPQRDERLGWMGDAQVFMRTATCNADVAAFFTKWMTDVIDAQTPEGLFPDVAPRPREDLNFVGLDDLCGGAGWADAGVIVPWTLWRVYGDTRVIERSWAAMTAWMNYLERTNPDHLRTRDLRNNYGDWLCIPTDTSFRTQSPMKNLLATAYWASDAAQMMEMAKATGRPDEAARYRATFVEVRDAFQREFCLIGGRLTVETQTAYLLALAFDLVPAADRAAAANRLVELIRDNDWHLSTGFIGIRFLNPILTLTGHVDVAYRLLLQETYPSWLYPVRHGATTIWERWNGWTHEEGFFNPSMNSFNHYSLGSVGEWLYRHVAGIELDPAFPGYERFVLKPYPGPGLDWARATHRTMHGEIRSHWRREAGRFVWEIVVPPNTAASVHLPATSAADVSLDRLRARDFADGHVVCEASAGTYRLESRL